MRIKLTITFTLFAIVLCVANSASAQRITRFPIWKDVTFSMQPSVEDELHLSDAQKESISKLDDKAKAELADLRQLGLTPQERTETAAELTTQHTKALEAILTPQQFTRFNEIAIRYWMSMDAATVLAYQLSDKLSVTAEQKAKLLELRTGQRKTHYQKLAKTPLSEMDKESRAICEAEKKQALEILTQDQQQAFDILQGDEFDLTTIDDYAKPKPKK